MSLYLNLAGRSDGPEWRLLPGVNHVGRAPRGPGHLLAVHEADVPEGYLTISKNHACIEVAGGQATIERVARKARLSVNERPLGPGNKVELKTGDHVVLGKVRFDVRTRISQDTAKPDLQGAPQESPPAGSVQRAGVETAEVATLRERHMRLECALTASQHILRREGLEAALEGMLGEVVQGFGLQCGLVAEKAPGGRLSGKAFIGLERIEDLSHVSQSIIQRALDTGKPYLVDDTSEMPGRGTEGSIEKLGIRSAMCAPLRSGRTSFGVLYLDNRGVKAQAPFNEEDESYLARMAEVLADALSSLRSREVAELHGLLDRAQIVGRSEPMLHLAAQIRRAARVIDASVGTPVLILGESGSGKELVARAIHAESGRRDMPYVEVNAGEFKENPQLAQSELFGTVKGAFPEACDRPGAVGAADVGVLFLDEIGDIPVGVQALLKRFLSDRSFGSYHRLGDERPRRSSAVVLMATNRDVAALVERGEFLGDFAERLRAAQIVKLPSLAEHIGDLPEIANHYLRAFNQQYHRQVGISEDGIEALSGFDWKDRNVRALVGVVREIVAATEHCGPVKAGARRVQAVLETRYGGLAKGAGPRAGSDIDRALWEVELDHCLAVWEAAGRVYSKAAAKLDIVEGTLKKKLIEGQYRRLGKDLERVAAFFGKDRDALEREVKSYQVRL